MATVEIPSFNFTAFYYAQILEALIEFKRTHCPELTNESTEEALIQMLRAMACVGHLNNVTADLIANECTLPTAKLVETVRNMLRLIDYEMSPATPAIADEVFELSQVLSATTEIIPQFSQVSTRREGTVAAVPFQILEAQETERTDLISSVLAWDDSAAAYMDYTTEANTQVGAPFTPWPSPVQSQDALYIGHRNIEWNKLKVELDTIGQGLRGIWEFHDGTPIDAKPDNVTKPGAYLRFELNDLLGAEDRSGTHVRVQFDQTGAYLDLDSQYSGGINFIDTDGTSSPYLGQPDPPSVESADYSVGSLWKELPDLNDGTDTGAAPGGNFGQDGDVDFTLPEGLSDEWERTTIEGVTAYWMRYRVISVSAPVAPIIDRLRIDTGKQYLKALAVQGQRQVDSPLGISDGSASQEYTFSQDYFIWATESVTVDGLQWFRVSNFLQSRPTDRHYIVQLGENDRATIKTGDGVRGAKPSSGAVVSASYRYGANANGNVGADTIVVDSSGIPYVSKLWNPRNARGWQESQGADEESLELAKQQGPASLRVIETALGPDDVAYLATNRYVDEDGVSLFTRALPIEESFGPKTIELVVVVAGGNIADAEQLLALNTYFNGDRYAHPPVRKRLVGNQEVTSTNFETKEINISADVYGDTTPEIVISRLTALLNPEARKDDGVTWEWDFGDSVRISRISHEIFKSDADIYDVQNLLINGSASDAALTTRQLPLAGTIAITVHTP